MAILTQGERITRDSIPVEVRVQRDAGPKSTIQEARESAEREHIMRALEESNWNVSGAARALGMERTNLHKRIRALGLTRGKYETQPKCAITASVNSAVDAFPPTSPVRCAPSA